MNTAQNNTRNISIFLAVTGLATVAIILGVLNLQAQRNQELVPTAPVQTVEYLLITPQDIGISGDLVPTIDYDETTRRLNTYAADGWRVRESGMFGLPVVLLERDVPPR